MKDIIERGGGWYQVGDETVRGRTAALRAANSGNGKADPKRMAVLSVLTELQRLGSLHGIQYGTARDLYKVGGYKRGLTYGDYVQTRDRDPIARRIVDMPAKTTWRLMPEISEPDEEEGTEFTKAWEELADRLNVWRYFERVDRLSRLGRYAVLLIGTGEDDQAMRRPLMRMPKGGPLYLAAYGEGFAKISKWVEDPTDQHYGMPELYDLTPSNNVGPNRVSKSLLVHHSRVLHVNEDLLEDDVFGHPALESLWNDLHDLAKISTSTAEAFWQRVDGVLTANVDTKNDGFRMDPDDMDELASNLEDLYHDLRRTFIGEGIKLERLADSEPDPGASADLYMTKIAAGAGIPKRILFGSETGERASSEDQKTWLGSVVERQLTHAEPAILRAFIDKLIDLNALPRPGAEGYDVVWPPLFEESETSIAEANLSRAKAAKELTPIGGNPLDLCEIDEERNIWLRPTGDRGQLEKDVLDPEPLPMPQPVDPTAPSPNDQGGQMDEAA